MQVRLTFHQTSDERLLVLTDVVSKLGSSCATTLFEHEDIFLRRVIAAELEESDMREAIATVILAVSQPERTRQWLEVELSPAQMAALGLDEASPAVVSGFEHELGQLHDFLTLAPTPFAMLSGPEHRFTFINQAYVDLIGQTAREAILGRTVRAVLPELEGQPFFGLLDEVYRSQLPYVGVEVPARLRRPFGGGYDDRHFDFIYQPVIGRAGRTTGILVQATEVTEKVLAREVSEQREQQLFRQWEELDTIYRSAPAAMALFCASDLRILRLNDRQADWMGSPASDLVGQRITNLPFHSPLYVSLLRRAAAGETIRDYLFHDTFCAEVVPPRAFRLSLSPFRNPRGVIEAISSMAVEQLPPLAPDCVPSQAEALR